jgi:hypothetical protein
MRLVDTPGQFEILSFIAGVFAIGLSLMIYHRQSQEEKDRTTMLRQITEYTAEVKKLQASVKSYPIKIIIANLNAAKMSINRDITLIEQSSDDQKAKFYRTKKDLSNGNTYHINGNTYSWTSRHILDEAQFLRPYIQSELYDEIHGVGSRINYFGDPKNLLEGIWETYDHWVGRGKATIKEIDDLAAKLEKLGH